jgi:protein-disulfide isomerase
MTISRRSLVLSGAAMLLTPAAVHAAVPGEMTIGNAGAEVRLVEYASLTCGHCARFHGEAFPRLKAAYIDTGRIAFTLREFPTHPVPVAVAMFQLARAGGANAATYYERVAAIFGQQRAILATGSNAGARDALLALGRGWGLSDAEMLAAMQDEAGAARVQAMVADGHGRGVSRTPSFVLNGQLLNTFPTFEALAGELDRVLAA